MSTTTKPNEETNKQDKSDSSSINWSNNSYVELENQFILRMPVIKQENGTSKLHPAGVALREALAKAAAFNNKSDDSPIDPLKDRLFININPETRKGQVKFDDDIFEARLVDLPCIIESLKTTDKKMFYKTADICQMLVCKTKDDPFSGDEDEAKNNKSKKSSNSNQLDYVNPLLKKYQWPHGITAPLKNVRRKRFRKIAKKKVIDYAEIEKEVKHLFRADREAVKIDYEIAYVEGDTDDEENKTGDNKDEDFDDSSADESAQLKSLSMKESANAGATKKYNKNKAESNFKSKSIIEESNMSSAEDMDYDSSMMLKTDRNDDEATNPNPKTSKYDELSNENSNVNESVAAATSSATADNKNNRTNFKNLFVKQVIGDLSSSSNDSENTDMDDEDEEEELESKAKSKAKAKSSAPPSGLFGEESMSNFEDAKTGGLSNDDSMSNLETAAKTKSLMNDTNNDEDSDEYQDEEDENNQAKVSANNLDIEDSSSNLNKKANEDFLSASSVSNMDNETSDKVEYRNRLNELNSELNKKREQIRQQENQINQIPNPMLRKRFEEKLNNLMDEEKKMMDEIEQIRALLDN